MPSEIHVNTYSAGEDNGRLAALAKELGLQKQRQARKQVRSSPTENSSFSFFRRSEGEPNVNFTNALHILVESLTPEEAEAKFQEGTDKFSHHIASEKCDAEEPQPEQETEKSAIASENKTVLTQRKTLQSKRGREKLGTCQVSLNLPENQKILLPGDSLPVDIEIAHSCYEKFALNEIRIRVHEIQTVARSKRKAFSSTKPRDIKLTKYDILTNGVPATWRKNAVIDIQGLDVIIPETALCDCSNGSTLVHHFLEIKLISSGREETLRFKFPLAIGSDQYTSVSNEHHRSFLKLSASPRKPLSES